MAEAEAKKDFFVSYNKADRTWAEWIAWHLDEAGYSTIIQAWDFRPGSNFVLEMQKATIEAERTIAVLSPHYLDALYTQPEWAAAFLQDPTGQKGVLLPVRVADCELKGMLAAIVYIDLLELEEEAAEEALLEGVRRESLRPTTAPGYPGGAPRLLTERPSFPGALPPIFNVPHHRNPNFTGREDLLAELREKLTSGGPAAVTQAIRGLGGVGKTQLALEYVYRHAGDYQLIWWVRSEEAAQLASDYAALATGLDLPEKDAQEQQQAIEAVRRWLEQNADWLLVFDNVPGPQEVRDYLPKGGRGHVIITSRNPAWRGVASPLSVAVWPRQESVEFLLRRAGQDDGDAADALAEELGDLPLALEQAAAYTEATGCSLAHYLSMFRDHRGELLSRRPESSDYPRSVAATFELAFDRVEEESPRAADLLNLCAFFAPDDIPQDIIREGAEHLPGPLAGAAKSNMAWQDVLAALRRYSLVEVNGDALSVHRLVQPVARDRLGEDAERNWAEAAVQILSGAFPPGDVHTNLQVWLTCARLLPHAVAATGRAGQLEVAPQAADALLNQTGLYLKSRAQFVEARAALERAIGIAESVYGPEHPEVAIDVNNLGSVLQDLGDLAGARAHFERALRIDEGAYGPDHPNVATDVNNLGSVLRALGDLAGAREHFERALSIDEGAYGPDHPDVAGDVNNLGGVLRALGDLEGAQEHYDRALRIWEQALGAEHPHVASAANNLGSVLLDLGDPAGARAHFERALRIDEGAYGPDHPNVAIRVNNLGAVLRALGDLDGARAHFERALRIDEKAYGPVHSTVGMHLGNLAQVLVQVGELNEAKELVERALAIHEKSYRADHPVVATSAAILGQTLQRLGDIPGARAHFDRALRIRREFLGDDHPETVTAQNHLESLGG